MFIFTGSLEFSTFSWDDVVTDEVSSVAAIAAAPVDTSPKVKSKKRKAPPVDSGLKEKKSDIQTKFWCWTMHQRDADGDSHTDYWPSDETKFGKQEVTFMAYQEEKCPDTGRHHYQGYVELKSKTRFSTLHKLFPRVHFEARRGTALQAHDYVKKVESRVEGGLSYMYGNLSCPEPGKRTDLTKACELIADGATLEEVALQMPSQFVLFHSGLAKYQAALRPKRKSGEPREVIVIWGVPGSGKSLFAFHCFGSSIYLPDRNNAGKLSFETYSDQETVFIDEFSGKENLGLSELKLICDRHDVVLPGRGRSVAGNYNRVILCSNIDPLRWYDNGPDHYWNPFVRRISAMYEAKSALEWELQIFDGAQVSRTCNPQDKFGLKPDGRVSSSIGFLDVPDQSLV